MADRQVLLTQLEAAANSWAAKEQLRLEEERDFLLAVLRSSGHAELLQQVSASFQETFIVAEINELLGLD